MYHELYLPFPPTVNNYYMKSKAGGRFISLKGRKFREMVLEAVTAQAPDVSINYRMLIEVVLFPPDRRQRDIDNYNKALFDAITHSGFWRDDQLIDQCFIYRGTVRTMGSVYLRVTEAGPLISDVSMIPVD